MALKYLIDECLHMGLTKVARAAGCRAEHVVHRGLTGAPDWKILEFMVRLDYVLVTNNAKDFRKLAGSTEIHPGMILILPNVPPRKQSVLFSLVLEYLDDREDLIDRVIEISEHHEISEYELPKMA